GEVMSIGKTYKEAFQKAIRSLETGRYGLGFAKNFNSLSKEELLNMLRFPTSERQFIIYEALRKGATVDEIFELTKIKHWFLNQMLEILEEENALIAMKGNVPEESVLRQAKLDGFSDRYLSQLLEVSEEDIRNKRTGYGICEAWEGVHVSGTEDAAYYYSTYHLAEDKSPVSDKPKIMILGGGPNRIGQGIEFDYCCVHAALALKKLGFESIIVNCNPETVSTDYDTSDKLYFEPLTLEDVLSIHDKEKPVGVIAQFGGQTPLNLANDLKKYGVNILGTTPETIDLAEDRDHFRAMMDKLGIPMPESGMAVNVDEALEIANRIGYPVMVRPSYVLGGRGMEIVLDDEMMKVYMSAAVGVTPDRPILIDRFLSHATECEADAISDGTNCFVPAVMEHIELAGIHSGDSACILPSKSLTEKQIATIKDYTRKIAVEMGVCGLMNMQYAIEGDTVYVLEANPRASRTVPLVSKVCSINMVQIATEIVTSSLTGKPSPVPSLKDRTITHYGVKEAVFPFNMFQEVDPVLGPEMRSTGEVLGISESFGEAYYKAQEAVQTKLPSEGTVLLSVCDRDKDELLEIAHSFSDLGFRILATGRTYEMIKEEGIPCERIYKIYEGRPNITDQVANGEIQLIINTPAGKSSAHDDSYIRKSAIKHRIPYITTMAGAKASAEGIRAIKENTHFGVKSLQAHHADIK
ncbi:MAG: carbamoyl-phosphate synthase large subunit, partial [Oscillospiraceae bacterium]|nr:carbamoyl-phosphate synthase large subunit [Oscillospiraceae bacterium]